MKAYRQGRIAQILRSRAVTSQAELQSLLQKQGEQVTQATLSRDLEELGAFKARTAGGRIAYRLPDDEPSGNGPALRRVLGEFVTGIEWSGNLVVLRTPPGCAQPVARAIDTAEMEGLLATVAGDDTVLAVVREGARVRAVVRAFQELAGVTRSKGA
jgi:transcriptional regulator of arginine metabolism